MKMFFLYILWYDNLIIKLRNTPGALNFECDQEGKFPKTRIGRTTLEDYRNVHLDELGKTRNYCQGKPNVSLVGFVNHELFSLIDT